MTLISKIPKIELFLQPRQILDLEEKAHQMTIECKSGVLWVTQSGELEDYMLKAGKRYVPKSKGKVVIQAMKESRLAIEER
jgi:hypothetical protein